MQRLLDFLYKHLTVLIFILLETLAVILLLERNEFSRSVVARHTLAVQASLNKVGTIVGDYFALNQTNKQLSEENARLYARLSQYKAILDSLEGDSIVSHTTPPRFTCTSARIVYASLSGSLNYVIINKGSADGIAENMGVIAGGWVYGVVGTVSRHYSTVLPLINTTVNVSAKVGSNDQIGVVNWDGQDRGCVFLDELPSHVHLGTGDSIFTSSFSTIFPENVLIGTVSPIRTKNTDISHVSIDVAVDFAKVRYVAVIRNVALPEYQELIDEMQAEEQRAANTQNQEVLQ